MSEVDTSNGSEISRSNRHEVVLSYADAMGQVQAFPDDMKLLEDPNIWVADSAATVDMTRHSMGKANLKKGKDTASTLCANGKVSQDY